jgi:DNA polymerase-4
MADSRSILHVDMDAFFASVEVLDDPNLGGKPVLVGHDGPRGVVAAASYEARQFGCHSAQPMSVAKRLCPHAVVMPVRGGRYRQASEHVFAIFERFTPLIEPLSIDEAFLDITGSLRLLGSDESIARELKLAVKKATGLTASVGLAPNKFLAKLASDLNKPNGLTIIRGSDVDRVLAPLSVSKIWGIGPKTAARLEAERIRTISDLRSAPLEWLRRRFGADETEHFLRLAHGKDDRPVTPDRQAKSIGQEQTFGVDVADPQEVRAVLLEQVEQVARRLRKHGLRARAVTLKIRYGDFKTITRRATLADATDTTSPLWQAALSTFDTWAAKDFHPVRLIGMSASGLTEGAGQLELFRDPGEERRRRLDQALDRITGRYGRDAIHRARPMGTPSNPVPD